MGRRYWAGRTGIEYHTSGRMQDLQMVIPTGLVLDARYLCHFWRRSMAPLHDFVNRQVRRVLEIEVFAGTHLQTWCAISRQSCNDIKVDSRGIASVWADGLEWLNLRAMCVCVCVCLSSRRAQMTSPSTSSSSTSRARALGTTRRYMLPCSTDTS